jgi:excisionase family DNA binding protein
MADGPTTLPPDGELMTPGEVAKVFRVEPKTVSRWDKEGKLSSIRTPGGHRRFRSEHIRELLERGGRA